MVFTASKTKDMLVFDAEVEDGNGLNALREWAWKRGKVRAVGTKEMSDWKGEDDRPMLTLLDRMFVVMPSQGPGASMLRLVRLLRSCLYRPT
jgi:hypothetical protein